MQTTLDSRRIDILARTTEACAGFVLVVLGFAHLAQLIAAMSSTGLWHDEIISIRLFSSQGLWTTLTHYPAPNNHIFFNALASLIPWSDPYEPCTARLWSFLATGLLGVCAVWAFAKRRSFIEAGLLIHILFMSQEFVALNLQARGYGLVSLFAMASGQFVWRHHRDPTDPTALMALGGISLLGMWTVPSYALFVAPMMVLAALSGPRWRNAKIGLTTVAATALVYAPVAVDVLASNRSYADRWGRQLDTPGEIIDALRLYLFHDESFVHGPNDVAIALLWIGIVIVALRSGPSAEARTARIMLGSGVFLIAISFALGTPPPRILLPALVAFAFAVALLLRNVLPPGDFVRSRGALALALVVVPHDRHTLSRFDFVPRERWKSIAQFIDRILPEDMNVAVRFRGEQLALYAEQPERLVPAVREADLHAGRSAILLNGLDPKAESDPIAMDPQLTPIRFRQNRGRHQTIYVAPPEQRLIERVRLVEIVDRDREVDLAATTDRDLSTRAEFVRPIESEFRYVELHLDVVSDPAVHTLLIVLAEGTTVGRVQVEVRREDARLEIVPESQIFEWGSAIAVDLDLEESDPHPPARITGLVVHIRPHKIDDQRVLAIREIWAYPRTLAPRAD
jgi:hypothetical protein